MKADIYESIENQGRYFFVSSNSATSNLPEKVKLIEGHQYKGRIYHLPFDQQYDSTIVEKERSECFVQTVSEAEERGYRRAFEWHGANTSA